MSAEPSWIALLDAAIETHRHLPTSRYAQLATVRLDGRPANRTVVVRGRFEPGFRPLITTDLRSDKVSELSATPWAELCWYFSETREQFRLFGKVTLVGAEGDSKLQAHRHRVWVDLPDASKRSFVGPAPGVDREADSAFDVAIPESPPDRFLLLVIDPETVDYLDLRAEPHGRLMSRREGEHWSTRAVNP
ncbi:MAG: pyridoxamine 5'-phosphate oxidase family protein [Isosphaeraceae bacterium]